MGVTLDGARAPAHEARHFIHGHVLVEAQDDRYPLGSRQAGEKSSHFVPDVHAGSGVGHYQGAECIGCAIASPGPSQPGAVVVEDDLPNVSASVRWIRKPLPTTEHFR